MKKTAITLFALALCTLVAVPAFAANPVTISQVYGGGGASSGCQFQYDYVELFNGSALPVNIGGWSLQYAPPSFVGNLGACAKCLTVLPEGATIPACGYYLIQLGRGTRSGPPLPVTPDFDASTSPGTNISGNSGQIGLKADAIPTPCNPVSAFVDLIGYGNVGCFETAPAPNLFGNDQAWRLGGGMIDTDNNGADFLDSFGEVPQNSQSPRNPDCVPLPTTPSTWGKVKSLYR